MSSLHVNLLTIRAADVERAVRFYSALGLRFAEERHGEGPAHHAAVCGGLVFEIYPLPSSGGPTSSTRLGFLVDDLTAATANLLAAGGALVTPPARTQRGDRAVVQDPEGHKVELLAAPA
jgi:lactoylglutathione lyase